MGFALAIPGKFARGNTPVTAAVCDLVVLGEAACRKNRVILRHFLQRHDYMGYPLMHLYYALCAYVLRRQQLDAGCLPAKPRCLLRGAIPSHRPDTAVGPKTSLSRMGLA